MEEILPWNNFSLNEDYAKQDVSAVWLLPLEIDPNLMNELSNRKKSQFIYNISLTFVLAFVFTLLTKMYLSLAMDVTDF